MKPDNWNRFAAGLLAPALPLFVLHACFCKRH